ncbi:MAG: hypothetical protein J0H43_07470 [Actinobacteria bacterium]|nr:hypothetical protein [Actinomycetota bacterium]
MTAMDAEYVDVELDLDDQTWADLERITAARGTTVDEIVCQILRDYITRD